MRGPYETSAEKFSNCVCKILELGGGYTIYESVIKCGVSYPTVKNYLTINLLEIQQVTAKKCKRLIKPEKISRSYPGFKVIEAIGGSGDYTERDLCTTELASDVDDVSRRSFWRHPHRHRHTRFLSRFHGVV